MSLIFTLISGIKRVRLQIVELPIAAEMTLIMELGLPLLENLEHLKQDAISL